MAVGRCGQIGSPLLRGPGGLQTTLILCECKLSWTATVTRGGATGSASLLQSQLEPVGINQDAEE